MSRMSRFGRVSALLAVGLALVLPASGAVAGSGPVATKSGALINYVSTAKLKVAKSIEITLICSANCNVVSHSVIKGPGVKVPGDVSGSLQANVPGGPFLKPNGPLLKAMKADPGKFKLVNKVTATDPVTGATDQISHTFKFKK
jgi:hypothetical protein